MEEKSKTILIVEDDDGLLLILTEIVEELGCSVVGMQTALKAIEWLSSNKSHLMVLDYTLPDSSGNELINRLKEKGIEVPPFIVSTGHGDEHIAVEMMKLGAKDYVVKDSTFINRISIVVDRVIREIENENRLKEAEHRLVEANQFGLQIIENVQEGIVVYDLDLKYKLWNPFMVALTGYTSEEVIGKFAWDIFPFLDPSGVLSNLKRALNGDSVQEVDFEFYIRKNERSGWASDRTTQLYNSKGELIGLIATIRDITERKKAEMEALDNEQQIRMITNNIPAYISYVDSKLYYRYVNENYEKLFGLKNSEIIGKHIREVLGEEYMISNFENIQKVLSGEKVYYENSFVTKMGDYIYVSVNCIPNFGDKGQVVGYYVFSNDLTERILSEKTLKESEERFKKVAESAEEWFWEVDANGLYTYSNSVVEKILGYSVDEMVGKKYFFDFFNLLEKEFLKESAFNVFRNQEKFKDFVNINLNKDGHKVILRTSGSPIVDDKGNLIGYRGVDADITKEKHMEMALKESEEKFRLSFKTSPDSININTLEGRYIEINEGFTMLTGYNESEALGKLSSELDIWDKPKDRERLIAGLLKDGTVTNLEAEFRVKDGTLKTALMSARIIKINDEPHILSITRDISERKKFEDSLKTLSWAVEQSPASIVITDTIGRIEYVNRKFTELTGYSANDAIGLTPSVLKSGYTSKEEYKKLWDTILSGKEWQGVFCNLKKNGEKYWETAFISPITNEKGEIIHFVAVKEDITEKRDQERKTLSYIVEAEERERNRFSRELHDGLGPILSTIKLFFQWLHQTDDESKRDMIFENGISNLNEAIDAIREISNNLSPRTITTFGVNAALKNFISNINQTQRLKIDYGSNIDNRFNKNTEIIIYRIVTELINNTLKYANASKVNINLNETDGYIKLQYTDDGIGFDYNKSVGQGKGIGLFNIIQRINTLDGTINVVSAIGKGVNIAISLPLESNNLV